MLKRINADQVQLGMYVRKFDGSWFHHPFWWARFTVQTENASERIRGSGLDLWIDSHKGVDLVEAAEPPFPARPAQKPVVSQQAPPRDRPD